MGWARGPSIVHRHRRECRLGQGHAARPDRPTPARRPENIARQLRPDGGERSQDDVVDAEVGKIDRYASIALEVVGHMMAGAAIQVIGARTRCGQAPALTED